MLSWRFTTQFAGLCLEDILSQGYWPVITLVDFRTGEPALEGVQTTQSCAHAYDLKTVRLVKNPLNSLQLRYYCF